jgi:hypothetical protein
VQVDAHLLLGPAVGALYLKDCFLLLERDEAVLVRGRGRRWRPGFGALDWRLLGREPWLCHPFKPWQPVCRLRWDAAAAPAPASASLPADPPERFLWPWAGAIWLMLFVMLPFAYYGNLGLRSVLLVLAELYLLILASLVLVWRRRAVLGLTGSQFGVLAFELLACAPYAPNLVRRLSLHRRVDESLLAASERLLDAPAQAEVRAQCLRRIDDELDWIAEDAPRAQALRAARPRFEARAADVLGDGGHDHQ